MHVLVIGSGAREHALCWALDQSPLLTRLYCAPGNGGTGQIAENVPLDPMDFSACLTWARENAIDFTIVGPDDPLAAGIVDTFQGAGLAIFGPSAAAARIESSKVWAKQLMLECGIPTAPAEFFSDRASAENAISAREAAGAFPVVIKADGLAAGKGVVVAPSPEVARAALDDLLVHHRLGRAGNQVLIEDYLDGWELSVFALTDGIGFYTLATACDYKRVGDEDRGANTGGMGAYSPAAVGDDVIAGIEARIVRPALQAIVEKSGAPFRGLLYAGLMITREGPCVVEFNARFGDPETQVVLPRLGGDLLRLCLAAAEGDVLREPAPSFGAEAACGVVMASGGYPGAFEKGKSISGLDRLGEDILVFHAGTERSGTGDQLVTSGGRVLTVVARGETVAEARARAYANVEMIHFEGAHFRHDIGITAAREAFGAPFID
jgi:phosphoribosylamine---glycine ligase